MSGRFRAGIGGFVPHHVGNETLLKLWDTASKRAGKPAPEELRRNRAAFRDHKERIGRNRGYIEDQGNYEDMHYGRVSMAYAGCEIIAVFNALVFLTGKMPRLYRLIAAFRKSGVSFGGRFGTSPFAIVRFFRRHGFYAETAFGSGDMEALSGRCSALILVYYNDRDDIGAMVHTIFISRERVGAGYMFTAHNTGSGIAGPRADSFPALLEKLSGGRAREILLIGINEGDRHVDRG